jgi:hypothetical protein
MHLDILRLCSLCGVTAGLVAVRHLLCAERVAECLALVEQRPAEFGERAQVEFGLGVGYRGQDFDVRWPVDLVGEVGGLGCGTRRREKSAGFPI